MVKTTSIKNYSWLNENQSKMYHVSYFQLHAIPIFLNCMSLLETDSLFFSNLTWNFTIPLGKVRSYEDGLLVGTSWQQIDFVHILFLRIP